jgi:hypothetical protein
MEVVLSELRVTIDVVKSELEFQSGVNMLYRMWLS